MLLPMAHVWEEEEGEAWDESGCLGTGCLPVLTSLASVSKQLSVAPSHHRALPPAPSFSWHLL